MPFQSKSQEKWMFSQKPAMAKRWASETSSAKDLPEYKGDKADAFTKKKKKKFKDALS